MAVFTNNLRLKEIGTGDEDGTWGTSTNTNLRLIADGFSAATKQMAANADETFTIPDATADGTRSLYLRITSAVSLTATRTVTLAPNTVSKVWIIENATSGGQSITIAQGSGATVTIANGAKVMVYTDGAGAGAAVVNANPSVDTTGLVTLTGTQTLTNKTITGERETRVAGGTGGSYTINLLNGNYFTRTFNANATISLSNVPATGTAQAFVFDITNAGAFTITWFANLKWPGGVAPTLTASGRDVLIFFTHDNGATWNGFVSGLDVK